MNREELIEALHDYACRAIEVADGRYMPESQTRSNELAHKIVAAHDTQAARIAELEADVERQAEIITARDARIKSLKLAMQRLVEVSDDGVWHSSEDCKTEGRDDCELCAALDSAREALGE